MNEEEKLIQEQFNRLPKELQDALNAVPWKSSVKEIALLNKLSLEQIAIVERETMFILYGFENSADYVANLMREVQIDETTATSIADEVNEKILKVITAQLDKPKEAGKIENSLPEIAPHNLPMIEEGEVAREVPHVEQKTERKPLVSTPNYSYTPGKDPYREPLE